MSEILRQVADVNGARYRLVEQIGHGGQGSVYAVDGGRQAVKILHYASARDRAVLRNQLAGVRRLDLAGLEIARPLEMLREPDLGFVMELLRGMEPLQRLISVPRGTRPGATWYQAGGGLRRRLRLLARVADTFAALHGKGITYSDPSPQNIFVSSDVEHQEVRLIDADNLHFASTGRGRVLYTPSFGAPEIVSGASPVNSLTDAHSFAVIVFQVLSLAHPLLGDGVMSGPPEGEDVALAGRLPWIDHPTDPSNRSSAGIPREYVMSAKLRELAGRAFGDGLLDPLQRPSISEWSERLHGACDATLLCAACHTTYYFTLKACPWCGAKRPAFVTVDVHLYDPAVPDAGHLLRNPPGGKPGPRVFARASLADGETLAITERMARGLTGPESARAVIEVKREGSRIRLRSVDGNDYGLEQPNATRKVIVNAKGCDIPISDGLTRWTLHFGDPDRFHRIARFVLHASATA